MIEAFLDLGSDLLSECVSERERERERERMGEGKGRGGGGGEGEGWTEGEDERAMRVRSPSTEAYEKRSMSKETYLCVTRDLSTETYEKRCKRRRPLMPKGLAGRSAGTGIIDGMQ
jgi:hypothetical protein